VAGAWPSEWDVTFFGVDPSRASDLDFGPVYLEIDLTYLVAATSAIQSIDEIDRPDVRIAVPKGNVPDLFLSRSLQHATLVRLDRRDALFDLLREGAVEGYASHRGELLELAPRLPGSRVLGGAFLMNRLGISVTKGSAPLLARVGPLVEQAISSGLVGAAVERAGLRGVRVARPSSA
jgi:polar amino acid transport system substrate-binding protein